MPIGRKKNLKIRTGARTASKGLEKELKRKAKRLAQDPTLALPKCTVEVPYFKKMERRLREVQALKDNRSALDKASKKGDKLVRAYAGTLLLLHEDRIQYLAVFRGPFGDVGYALRGQTNKEKLVGIQHYDDPRVKMMAYLDDVKKKKLFMFVLEKDLICTGTDPKPPDEIIDLLPKRLGKGMLREKDLIRSKDLPTGIIRQRKPWKEPYLVVSWKSAGIDIARSLSHASLNKDNAFATCATYMATPNISEHFSVKAVVNPICDSGESCPCHPTEKKDKKEGFLKRLGKVKEETDEQLYLQGKVMDHRYIEKARASYENRLEEDGRTVYIVENVCYGDSKKKLMEKLKPRGKEKKVMDIFLDHAEGPLISGDPSPNRIMAPLWDRVGKKVLEEFLDDRKAASRVFDEYPVPRYQPMKVVAEGEYLIAERRARKRYRKPVDPPQMIDFAYECAVSYMVRGREGASRVLEEYKGEDIKLKAAKYAFVKHLDLEKKAGWSYTTHEVGYAQGLDRIVDRIISEDPEEFEKGLEELWRATGSTKELRFK